MHTPSPQKPFATSARPSPKGKATFITGGDFFRSAAPPMSQGQTRRDLILSLSPKALGSKMAMNTSLPEIPIPGGPHGNEAALIKEMQREKERLHRYFLSKEKTQKQVEES